MKLASNYAVSISNSNLWGPAQTLFRIDDADGIYLIPENLAEAKFVLCLAQQRLEASGQKYKKNRPIVRKALRTSTLKGFTKAIDGFKDRSDPPCLFGLYEGLADMDTIDCKYVVIP